MATGRLTLLSSGTTTWRSFGRSCPVVPLGRLDRHWAAVRLLKVHALQWRSARPYSFGDLVHDWPRWRRRIGSVNRIAAYDFLVGRSPPPGPAGAWSERLRDRGFFFDQLSPLQDDILGAIAELDAGFYLTGGTAAWRAYLPASLLRRPLPVRQRRPVVRPVGDRVTAQLARPRPGAPTYSSESRSSFAWR